MTGHFETRLPKSMDEWLRHIDPAGFLAWELGPVQVRTRGAEMALWREI